MFVMWWMPSSLMRLPPGEILECSNTSTRRAGTERTGPAPRADAVLPRAMRSLRFGERPRNVAQHARLRLDSESGELHDLPHTTWIEDEPLPAVASRVEARERGRQEGERRAHHVEQQ